MEERDYIISLYDYYQNLLTEKQKEYFEDYYYENLTMDEIAENESITKNAVSKQLINIKEKLINYENALKLYNNKLEIYKIIKDKKILDKLNKFI